MDKQTAKKIEVVPCGCVAECPKWRLLKNNQTYQFFDTEAKARAKVAELMQDNQIPTEAKSDENLAPASAERRPPQVIQGQCRECGAVGHHNDYCSKWVGNAGDEAVRIMTKNEPLVRAFDDAGRAAAPVEQSAPPKLYTKADCICPETMVDTNCPWCMQNDSKAATEPVEPPKCTCYESGRVKVPTSFNPECPIHGKNPEPVEQAPRPQVKQPFLSLGEVTQIILLKKLAAEDVYEAQAELEIARETADSILEDIESACTTVKASSGDTCPECELPLDFGQHVLCQEHASATASSPAARPQLIPWCRYKFDDNSQCPREAEDGSLLCAKHQPPAARVEQPTPEQLKLLCEKYPCGCEYEPKLVRVNTCQEHAPAAPVVAQRPDRAECALSPV